jgi:four helix bundle protein
MITNHNLEAWKLSIRFVTAIYQVTGTFPKAEQFSLTSQLRRAAISVPSNIVEGAGRSTLRQYRYFINVALGSIAEIETQLIISLSLNYIRKEELNALNEKKA